MDLREMVETAREIIAVGCGCHRDCEEHKMEECGCRDEAKQIIALVLRETN